MGESLWLHRWVWIQQHFIRRLSRSCPGLLCQLGCTLAKDLEILHKPLWGGDDITMDNMEWCTKRVLQFMYIISSIWYILKILGRIISVESCKQFQAVIYQQVTGFWHLIVRVSPATKTFSGGPVPRQEVPRCALYWGDSYEAVRWGWRGMLSVIGMPFRIWNIESISIRILQVRRSKEGWQEAFDVSLATWLRKFFRMKGRSFPHKDSQVVESLELLAGTI